MTSAREELHGSMGATREKFAVVDDAISAGSATRATVDHLKGMGAPTVVVAALMILGDRAEKHFKDQSIPILSLTRSSQSLWEPQECPLCRKRIALERPAML